MKPHNHSPLVEISGAPNDATRRNFLGIMGASVALATGAGCTRQGTDFLLPYVNAPEQVVPGRPKYYATATVAGGMALGVMVESHLGRPTKIEGNPNHPASLGATDVISQATVLDLYDPFRAKDILHQETPSTWDEFVVAFQQALAPIRSARGRGLSLLTETVISPSLGWQIGRVLAEFPEAKWHQWEPAGAHSARQGANEAFGRDLHTHYRLDNADVVLSLDSDFLTVGAGSTRYAHDYAFRRRVRGSNTKMNRLYAVESSMTSTGGKADHRLQLRYPEVGRFAVELAASLGGLQPGAAGGQRYANWIGPLSRDLMQNAGRSAILVGENQPAGVHALAHAMNARLGNAGKTVIYTEPLEARPEDQVASLARLVNDMRQGQVQLLLIFSGNPAYNAPADIDFAGALGKAPLSVFLGLFPNETSRLAHWHIPESHSLETWSDARAFDGTVTILQPLIEPLYHSHSQLEMLDLLLHAPNWPSHRIVQTYWESAARPPDFEGWWRRSVGNGLVEGSAAAPITPPPLRNLDPGPLLEKADSQRLGAVFLTDPFIYDGRYASNAWLQELPRHITKLTWDNAVHVSPRTAARLQLENQHTVQLRYRGRSVEGSVWITPGNPDDSITVHLGYGRENAGVVGSARGFNAYRIRTSDALWYADGVEIRRTGKMYPLATAQMHKSMEGRDLLISKPVDTYRKDPDFVHEMHREPKYDETLYPHWTFPDYSWGMAIDLTACVNCSACVIACQAENNIPVVGKEQQLFNREMHWLRVDVYYSGSEENATALYQPVPCMHCENAPCELVCPVQATVHSSDGLNDMIYNRCVGTRFCSNNCPYKVRRFNFLLYSDWYTETLKMQKNPDVTVRSRGVIEKCTYCVQRIREADIRSQNENRRIRDGEVQTACQQVCPTQAIIFGDMKDASTRVSRLKREKLNYSMLAELNTRPHTTYLAELRNPNPELSEKA